MKKMIALALCLVLALSLGGCGEKGKGIGGADMQDNNGTADTEKTQTASIESGGMAQETIVLKEPPALTVLYGDNNSIEALKGTYSWMYQNEDGTWTGMEADSIHPLAAKEYMPSLQLLPVVTDSNSHLKVKLQWDIAPDEITVRCWDEADWGQTDAESEELPVRTLTVDSDPATEPAASVELKDGSCVYEVIAAWNSAEQYNGNARYSFYTVK